MVRFWHVPKTGIVLPIFATYFSSLVLGLLMLAWVVVRTMKEQRAHFAGEVDMEAKAARDLSSADVVGGGAS